jgi:hypothetical protein
MRAVWWNDEPKLQENGYWYDASTLYAYWLENPHLVRFSPKEWVEFAQMFGIVDEEDEDE